MIVISLHGGLGNQMFQYAFGRSIALKHNTNLLFDLSNFNNKKKNTTRRKLELEIFDLSAREATDYEIKSNKPLFWRLLNTLKYRLGFKRVQSSNYFFENGLNFNPAINKISNKCYISGYWQSYKYFQNIENIIKDNFRFPILEDAKNKKIIKEIQSSNSVSIHLRRGDFLNVNTHSIHGTCSLEYYQGAISYIENKITNPIFFIFSDDIEWVKSNFNFEAQIHFVYGNIGNKSYIDMQLMSQCKHNIIANSSFSWWGAWLNQNYEKIVLAPNRWFASDHLQRQSQNIIPENWIRL
jgi:hypothetical protein